MPGLNHSHHEAHFVGNGDMDTQESVNDTRRKENDGLLETNTQRKDGDDQAPVLNVEPSLLMNAAITPVAPSSGRRYEDQTGKAKPIHYNNPECPGILDGPRANQVVIPEGDGPQTHHEDPDTDCPSVPVSDQHSTTPKQAPTNTPGALCTL